MSIETAVQWQAWIGFIAVSVLGLGSLVLWAVVLFAALPQRLLAMADCLPVLGFAHCVFWNRRKGKGFMKGLAIDLFVHRFRDLQKHEPEICQAFLERVNKPEEK